MAEYLMIAAQQIFNASDTSIPMNASSSPISTSSITDATSAPLGPSTPADLTGWVAFMFSFSAVRDWVKLILIGAIFEALRRIVLWVYDAFFKFCFVSASFTEHDESYEWILTWLSKQPSWTRMRDFEVSTWSWYDNRNAIVLEENEMEGSHKATRKLSFLPSIHTRYNLFFKYRWVRVLRVQSQTGYWGSKEQTLYIQIMTRDTDLMLDLLRKARQDFLAAQEDKMCIYVSNSDNDWKYVAARDKRGMNSIILDPGIKDLLLRDARDFLSSKKWYKRRGIPFRRGYLLYGPPGSGKTSVIHAVAGALDLNVYVISLSRSGLDDNGLSELINKLPERCIALMEDIDAAFTHGVNRDENGSNKKVEDSASTPSQSAAPGEGDKTAASRITLSGLLNALDGIGAQEGRILFATTNRYSVLDPALCRPGRMDLHIEFKNASKHQAKELFKEFYLPSEEDGTPSLSLPLSSSSSSSSVAVVTAGDDSDEKESVDSGYESTSEDVDVLLDDARKAAALSSDKSRGIIGTIHTGRAPNISKRKMEVFAEKFAKDIPEREVSMASLQGYLMWYKADPITAVAETKSWVEKERREKREKEEKARKEREEREKKEKEEREKKEKEEKEKAEREKKEKEEKEKKV